MSKGHHASRRHSYNRRQHELHERLERTDRSSRLVGVIDWLSVSSSPGERQWPFERALSALPGQRGTH